MKITKTLIALTIAAFALTGCGATPAVKPAEKPAAATESETETETIVEEEPAAAETGTRDNPHPLGTTVSDKDWSLTVNSVDLDATAAVMDENMFNDEPGAGNVYILVNVTVTYDGDDPDGQMPAKIIEYVTAEGNTIDSFSALIIAPDAFDSLNTLYSGASTTGNVAFEVPEATAAEGTLAVKPYILSDKSFFALQ